MSDGAKVEIVVVHPNNPLAPPPRLDVDVSQSDLDGILLKLPQWRDDEETTPSATLTHDSAPASESPDKRKPLARSPQERVRNLSMAEAQKIARTGEQADRVALERLYGKAVWETLLHNSRLTPPEVLRIARMASLPVPLLELIVGNRGWLSSPQVRRALLANRRLTKDMIATVLRATPKNELRLMQKQTAYPPAVREAAAKFFK